MTPQMAKGFMQTLQRLVIMFCLVLVPVHGAAQQEAVRHGLMWNRTGLPAVFPLQVRTVVGPNYYLTLHDAETGAQALAAYIEGGRFFQVLVPPGTFEVRFDYGGKWQGEETLFGGSGRTGTFELAEPLTFEVRSFSVKGGHVIDLTTLVPGREARADTAPQSICQTQRLIADAQAVVVAKRDRRQSSLPDTLEFHATPLEELAAQIRPDVVLPEEPEEATRQRQAPRYDIRQRLC